MKNFIFFLCFLFFADILFAQENSVLALNDWYKISTDKNGVYKIDYDNLQDLGIDVTNLQTQTIRLYGNGGGMLPHLNSDFRYNDLKENPIKIFDQNSNGIFDSDDYFIFYGMSPDRWFFNQDENLFEHETHLYSDKVFYFITIDNNTEGLRIQSKQNLNSPSHIISSFHAYSHHEEDLENLIKSGRKWFGERFSEGSSQSFEFNLPNLVNTSPIFLNSSVAARSFQSSNFEIGNNSSFSLNLNIPTTSSDFAQEYAKEKQVSTSFFSDSDLVNLSYKYESNDNGASAWLDYIVINCRRELKLSTNYMHFRDLENISNSFGEYRIQNAENCIVWDVTNPLESREILTSFQNGILSFTDSLHSLKEYLVFNTSAYLNPNLIGLIENQNIRASSNEIDMIIVTYPDFASSANRLANFHLENDNILSLVVTPDQIYNEFSSGMQDVCAIRDFVKFQFTKNNSSLKYLLLLGDGSFDPKNRTENNTNFIPTYQSLNSTHPVYSYVTDDFFVLLDENEGLFNNDLVDIGVGRLPARSLEESNIFVDKIEQYSSSSSFGSWRNDVVFIADDGDSKDGNTHMWQADSLANHVADNYRDINIKKIYLDNYQQESTPGGPRSVDAQTAINNQIESGSLLVNYTGHGGPLGWTQERILEIDQIRNWNNIENMPLFMTATCKFSYFDNPDQVSAGEELLLNPNGGAIALFSTTRLVYSQPNYNLNTKFIENIFTTPSGEFLRLGDLFKITKQQSGTSSNNRNFILLGDPALRLAYPKLNVETISIADTLKALSEVQVSGQITTNGSLASNFNGVIYPVVYDKEIIRTTLGQESCTPMPYRDQSNIIYKGAASVVDGIFSFNFIVPKDIAYNYANGKISYYAIDNQQNVIDANGSSNDFVIGGTADNISYDYQPADLSLFINDTLFINGGLTNQNPVLLAYINDESGINTVGNGIGHDITAILDGTSSNPYILNDYYQSAQDDFTKGKITFPMFNLTPGEHSLTLKVWDVFNNSSEETITFVVVENDLMQVDNFISYPNPFMYSTDFYFEHNKSNQMIDYELNIYSVTGSLVRTIEEKSYFSQGFRVGPINWDGRDDLGHQMSSGIYIARLNISDQNNLFESKTARVILLPK